MNFKQLTMIAAFSIAPAFSAISKAIYFDADAFQKYYICMAQSVKNNKNDACAKLLFYQDNKDAVAQEVQAAETVETAEQASDMFAHLFHLANTGATMAEMNAAVDAQSRCE